MVVPNEVRRTCIMRLLRSRMRILVRHGFYGLLLMHMDYSLDPGIETAATDGEAIYFSPAFMETLSDSELDFVMMHETMHVILRHVARRKYRDRELFNVACDIVVNSNILLSNGGDRSTITLKEYGESMHCTPEEQEGFLYSIEEVYEMLAREGMTVTRGVRTRKSQPDSSSDRHEKLYSWRWDDHSMWGQAEDKTANALWTQRILSAADAVKNRSGKSGIPLCIRKLMEDLKKIHLDWRTLLHEFIQQETVDYTLVPPDHRYTDSPFFLPGFNEREDYEKDILFMIDTSGSMSEEEITMVYQEVANAVGQFGGRLLGLLGFFDDKVTAPVPFHDVSGLKEIIPRGGGGTDFHAVFQYISQNMADKELSAVIILTDGYASFPQKNIIGIPVLWVINNERITPPWGRIVRLQA